jgi:hypothetical protein
MDIPLYEIRLLGGFEGTVEVASGTLQYVFPPGIAGHTLRSGTDCIRRYHFCLLTPDRRNIEFELYKIEAGPWWDPHFPALSFDRISQELREAAKTAIEEMRI